MLYSEENKTVRKLDSMIEAAGMSESDVYIYKKTPRRISEDNSKFSYIFLQTLRLIYIYIYICVCVCVCVCVCMFIYIYIYIYNRPICV